MLYAQDQPLQTHPEWKEGEETPQQTVSSVTKITDADPRGVIKPKKDAPNTRVVPVIYIEVVLFKSPAFYTDIRQMNPCLYSMGIL